MKKLTAAVLLAMLAQQGQAADTKLLPLNQASVADAAANQSAVLVKGFADALQSGNTANFDKILQNVNQVIIERRDIETKAMTIEASGSTASDAVRLTGDVLKSIGVPVSASCKYESVLSTCIFKFRDNGRLLFVMLLVNSGKITTLRYVYAKR